MIKVKVSLWEDTRSVGCCDNAPKYRYVSVNGKISEAIKQIVYPTDPDEAYVIHNNSQRECLLPTVSVYDTLSV